MNSFFLKTAALAFLLVASGSAQAAIFEFVRQLPSGTATTYGFGQSVDTDGVLVGVSTIYANSTPGASGGAGYVFSPDNGPAIHRLADSTSFTADAYGLTIAVEGERTLVSAPRGAPGTVYFFDNTTGAVLAKPQGDVRTENSFGMALAMDQGLAIVGSPREPIRTGEQGAAYIYNSSNGARVRKITSGTTTTPFFGTSVDIDGNLALISSSSSLVVGAGHLFDIATGDKVRDLVPNDNPIGDGFGWQVAIADGVAIIGAPGSSSSGSRFGSAYLFDVYTGQQIAKLFPSGSSRGDYFGMSVAIDNGIALVGSPRTDAVYAFDARTGAELQKINRPSGTTINGFGASVAFRDGLAVIGSSLALSSPGTAYVFRLAIPEPHALLLALTAVSLLAIQRR